MKKPIIETEGLSKLYRLGVIGMTTLRDSAERWWNKVRGKEELSEALTLRKQTVSQDDRQAGPEPNSIWALRDVSLSVKKGEVLGIIGKNGAGKSTLLKILSRITEPTEGTAVIRGRISSLLEVGTGFHPELTGRENIYLNGTILGMRKHEIDRKFDEIVAFSEIEKFIDTPAKRYSSGMYVRLAFAVAAHLEPEILLVDEVLAVGDIVFQQKCMRKMQDVAKQGRTVLFVSHSMAAISMLCTSAILLRQGRIVSSGGPSGVIDDYLAPLRGSIELKDAEVSFSEDLKKPAQIRDIRILNPKGEPSLRYDLQEPIRIDISFTIRRAFPTFFVACNVLTTIGHYIFTTNEMDWLNYTNLKVGRKFPKKPGRYKASLVLPAPLLLPGIYELWFALSDMETPGNIDNARGIFVEIADSRGSFATYPFKRGGLLALPVKWKVEQEK